MARPAASVALAAALLAAIPGGCVDFHVSPGGDDLDDGSQASPWRTIQKAADSVMAGDTVYIAHGIYPERVTMVRSGRPDGWITFRALPGHQPAILGDGTCSWDAVLTLRGVGYVRVEGIEVSRLDCYLDGTVGWGVLIEHDDERREEYPGDGLLTYDPSTHIVLSGMEVHHTGSEAILVRGHVRDISILDSFVHHGLQDSGIDIRKHPDDDAGHVPPGFSNESFRPRRVTVARNQLTDYVGNDGVGAAIATERADEVRVQDNIALDSKIGLDIGCGRGNRVCRNEIIGCISGIAVIGNQNSEIHQNTISGATGEAFLSYDHEVHVIDEVHEGNRWYRNLVKDCNVPFLECRRRPDWETARSAGHEVFQNIFDGNLGPVTFENTTGLRFFNNVVYAPPGADGAHILADSTGATVLNNIVSVEGNLGMRVDASSIPGTTLDYNAWQDRSGAGDLIDWAGALFDGEDIRDDTYFAQTGQGEHSLALDPEWADPAGGDFHLRAGSPCVDAGADVGLPYMGGAPDMGAFEYVPDLCLVRSRLVDRCPMDPAPSLLFLPQPGPDGVSLAPDAPWADVPYVCGFQPGMTDPERVLAEGNSPLIFYEVSYLGSGHLRVAKDIPRQTLRFLF